MRKTALNCERTYYGCYAWIVKTEQFCCWKASQRKLKFVVVNWPTRMESFRHDTFLLFPSQAFWMLNENSIICYLGYFNAIYNACTNDFFAVRTIFWFCFWFSILFIFFYFSFFGHNIFLFSLCRFSIFRNFWLIYIFCVAGLLILLTGWLTARSPMSRGFIAKWYKTIIYDSQLIVYGLIFWNILLYYTFGQKWKPPTNTERSSFANKLWSFYYVSFLFALLSKKKSKKKKN